ncbi:FtsX-like permease family protein [uncultured Clostridium sp.]|uniref:FtsX-like permease family protein n=1 Tax=uncultured Clostridium sp. TaxID=59620 RepID=UPI0032175681
MYFKLAARNLKRSFKDYTIYFLTLVFGVCIFYTFNSIEAQSILMEVSEMHKNMFHLISNIMGVASIFISFILGFLIVYANSYLIKRRKKEFGVYMTLGMENSKLSSLLFIETMMIGVVSLALGLILGIFLSQGLSVVTAKLFKVNLTGFKFIFSRDAFIRTVVCFGVIYFIILVFNSFTIRNVKLINLLTSSKKNEKVKIKNVWTSVVVFIISVVTIGYAYYIVLKNGMSTLDKNILIAIGLGAVGTFLFFFSLAGFLLKVVQSSKKIYLRNLNMFVLRQINSKINTTFISMTFICLMLFVAICTLSGGLGISTAMNTEIRDLTQFDMSFCDNGGADVETVLKEHDVDVSKYEDNYVSYQYYDSGVSYKDFLSENGLKNGNNYYPVSKNLNINVMKVSDFNKIMKMLNREEVSVKSGEYAVFGDISDMTKNLQEALENDREISIGGKKLRPYNGKALDVVIYSSMMKHNICTFLVEDSLVENLTPIMGNLNINFNDDGSEIIKALEENIRDNYKDENLQTYYLISNEIMEQSTGLGALASYLAIYMGIIFLITSAAVLALQQLSESADNTERYNLLRKVGVEETMINNSILTQVAIYFMMPLSLAIIHSIVGLKLASDIVAIWGGASMVEHVFIAAFVLVIVYGGYFLATYLGSKKMIKGN